MKLRLTYIFTCGLLLTSLAAFFSRQDAQSGTPVPTENWTMTLPKDLQTSILWCADHEEGTLFDWEYDRNPDNKGGGVFTTGTPDEAFAKVEPTKPFTGRFCANATIHNAFQSRNGSKAVRLMRRTDKPWNQGGKFFPISAYYGIWMRLDKNYSVTNKNSPSGGWWNVFQFKSNDKQGKSQPIWVLNIGNDKRTGQMHFYLYSKHNKPSSISQKVPLNLPVGRWFHVEALYEQSKNNAVDGRIRVWQDGKLIISVENVKTVLAGNVVWGVGNYTDHITGGVKPGTATIYFDDATISTKPTHPYAQAAQNKQLQPDK